MVEPAPERSLKRVWIWALILIVAIWIIYALMGGPSRPSSPTASDSAAQSSR